MIKGEMILKELNNISGKIIRPFLLVPLLMLSLTAVSCSQGTTDDVDWLIDVLSLGEGSVVADIGAGDGQFSLALARQVGPGGQVYSTELGADSVAFLQNVVDETNISNVRVIEGRPDHTNLPEECCNALFLRKVYHHIDEPSVMNKSIWESLKPGGRVAIIDFVPRGSVSEDPKGRDSAGHHGVTAEAVAKELEDAGFTIISKDRRSGRDIYVVAEKRE